jgi:sigma-B regulation protein RsbU (phosphoserine phosphatase)
MSADIVGAHGHLASIDPQGSGESLLSEVLKALLEGSGATRGVIIGGGPSPRAIPVGLTLRPEFLRVLTRPRSEKKLGPDVLPVDAAVQLFGPGKRPEDACFVPLTVGDETMALAVMENGPSDPSGFASIVAHAASILAWVRSAEKVRQTDFELKYRVWELESLYDVGLSIAGTLDLDSLADDILLKSISLLNARSGTLIVWEPGHEEEHVLQKHFGSPLITPEKAFLLPAEVLVANLPEERLEPFAQAPAEKLLSVPIESDNQLIGVLVVADKENRQGGVDDFGETDARTLSLFGNQAAIALENARLHRQAVEKERMEREIELAAAIQRAILPEYLPPVSGLELAGGNKPTRQVGGDYYDVFFLPDGRSAFCVADVSGKGVPAALLVSTLHACLHLLLEAPEISLTSIIARINQHLIQFSSTRKFVTVVIGLFDPVTRTLRYVSAGHNPGILLSGGKFTLLPATGVPIGMLPNVIHEESVLELSTGDLLVLYSDGITEALTATDEEFGMDRLMSVISTGAVLPAMELTRRIFDEVSEFTRGVAQYDDQTVLTARVL